jgi:hypothetical protein
MMGLRIAGGIGMALTLAACASDPIAAPLAAASMAGRWTLDAPNAPSCRMAFEGAPGARQGTILADGGCPGEMFRSRSWVLANDALTINDGENRPLATLKRAASGFQGTSSVGLPVTLARVPS